MLAHTSMGRTEPARVIGPNSPPIGPRDSADSGDSTRQPVCTVLTDHVMDGAANPASVAPVFTITVFDSNRQPFPALRVHEVSHVRGLDLGWRAELAFTSPTSNVWLTLVVSANPVLLTAFDAHGTQVAAARSSVSHAPETLALVGVAISRVVIESPSDESVLSEVCLPAPDVSCMRALQLPEQYTPIGTGDVELTPRRELAAQQRADERWTDLVTGRLVSARLYLALTEELFRSDGVVVEEVDIYGRVIVTSPLTALSPVFVTGRSTGLPTTWTDPTGPWLAEVNSVATLLDDPSLGNLLHVWVAVAAKGETERLRIRVQGRADPWVHPSVVLAAAEVLTSAEVERVTAEESSRTGQIDTLTRYLDKTAAVPLLSPRETYTLHVDYLATSEDKQIKGDPIRNSKKVTESFRFKTDSQPPARLDAYVLATAPRHEEQFVFADDPLDVVFNDRQIVQLYKAYGRTLTAVLRGADGIPIPDHQVDTLDEVPSTYTSPLYDSLDALINAGGLKCVRTYHRERHAKFTVPEKLRPSMAYTLDIEAQPIPVEVPARTKPIVPLFRRQFRTGRFRNIDELLAEIRARGVEHRLLTGPISGLPAGVAADLAIEQALLVAGLPALGAPTRGTRVVLWRPVGGRFVPHAVLLDASEPLWRWRMAPVEEVVPNAGDPAFKRIIPGEEFSLRLEATGPVTGFVRSPSGTRTLVLLADTPWPSAGATVVIDAVRPASMLFDVKEQRVTVTTLPLGGHAPWEDDDA
jgi:hypothetical protein